MIGLPNRWWLPTALPQEKVSSPEKTTIPQSQEFTLYRPDNIAKEENPSPPANDPKEVKEAPVYAGPDHSSKLVASSSQEAPEPYEEPGTPPAPACQTMTLQEAIDLAFRLQPRLRVYLENIRQAEGQADIAFSPFLPSVAADYSVGGFRLNVGGQGIPLGPGLPQFNFLPPSGALPVGLDIQTGYELAELKLQWLICDFGRRLGRYRQADLGIDIAQLQTSRAYQTIANEVAVAYYQVLRTRALRRTAGEAVRRAEDELDVARKLSKGGVIEREKVLRAQVQVAQARRALDAAEAAEAIAVAALNLAIGLQVNTPTCVAETDSLPPFSLGLCECLQTAINQRREFQVARRTIQVSQEGVRVAKADFAPRIVAEGLLLDYQQSSPRGHADLPLGFIKLEWGLFQGGKRVAEVRVADSKVRASMAEAQSIADTIAFQVTEAYRRLVAARRGIDRARPAVVQARENYRLVRARFLQGDATPADITDAETALTRAQDDYLNSLYDYLTAVARLEYAMGSTATPFTVCRRHG
jgi:outer membrane protein TolC